MSIYATIGTLIMPSGRQVRTSTCAGDAHIDPASGGRTYRPDGTYGPLAYDEYVEVYFQGVPAHIQNAGPGWDEWLPPPVPDCDGELRAVFVCGPSTTKGTDRNGQEYVNALAVLGGAAWQATPFPDLWRLIDDALATHWY